MKGTFDPCEKCEELMQPYLDRALKGQPTYEPNGSWPWEEDFFPKPKVMEAAK